MVSAVQSALSGLHSAQLRAQEAANRIVGISSGTAAPSQTSSSTAPQGTAPLSLLAEVPLFESGDDLATSLVALKQAEFSYKASAKLLAVAHSFEDTLLEALK